MCPQIEVCTQNDITYSELVNHRIRPPIIVLDS